MESKFDQMEKVLQDREMEVLFARVASSLLDKGNKDEAVKICENGLKRFPMYAQGHYILAKAYQSKGMSEEARGEYERTIKYDPNHLSALLRLTEIYNTANLPDLYRQKLAQLLLLDPLDPDVQKLAPGLKAADGENVTAAGDPLDVSKIDLTQFNNQDDDFTTIIHGKEAEVIEPEQKEENIQLGVGVTSNDMNTDTETNQRMEYETEKRILDDARSPAAGDANDFENLDELKFDDEGISGETSNGSRQEWAMEVADNDATEILFKKKPDKKKTPITPEIDEEEESDSSEYKHPKIVTQTLGEILVSQKKYTEALRVFETLQELHPENKNIVKKVDFLKKIIALEQK